MILVKLHKRVDLFVELPAIAGVSITGLSMLDAARWSAAVIAMMVLGTLAIVANLYCVYLVFRRAAAAEAGESASFQRYDRLQHRIGGVVLVAILGALALGLMAR